MEKRVVQGTVSYYEIDMPDPAPRGTAVPLVLLHGFPLDSRVWAGVAQRTARHVPTLRPDFRGFGRLATADAFTIETLADDVVALLRALDFQTCVLAGLSMGGYVAFDLVLRYPQAVAGVAFVDTRSQADTPEGRKRREEMMKLVRRHGATAVCKGMIDDMTSQATRRDRPEVVETLYRIMSDCPAPTIFNALQAMRDRPDYTPRLGGIGVPSSVIVGEADAITPPDGARELAGRLKSSAFTSVASAGHMAPYEAPDVVAEALMDLYRRAVPAQAPASPAR